MDQSVYIQKLTQQLTEIKVYAAALGNPNSLLDAIANLEKAIEKLTADGSAT